MEPLISKISLNIIDLDQDKGELFKDYIIKQLNEKKICNDPLKYSRKDHDTLVRFGLYFFLNKLFNYSSYKIGSLLNRDHSSILNGLNKFHNWIEKPNSYGNQKDTEALKKVYMFFITSSIQFLEN